MADARYIVEIILQARDQTAEAFASATGHQEDLNRLQKESAQQADELREADQRMAQSLLRTRQDLKESQRDLNLNTQAGVQAQVALEEATKHYVRISNDAKSSDAQRTVALGQMVEATKALGSAIKEANQADQEWTTARARGQAERIRNANIEREQARQISAAYQEAGRVASASIRQLEQDEARRDQARLARIREFDATQRQAHVSEQERQREAERSESARASATQRRLQERQRIEREVEQAAQRLARVDLGDGREIDVISQKLARLGQEYEKTGASASRVARIQQDTMRAVRRDVDALEKQYLKYEQAMRRVTETEKRRLEAITAGDKFVEIEARIQSGEALREAAALRAEINAVLSHVVMDVDLDLNPAQLARIEAVRAGIGRRIEIDVDLNVSTFDQARGVFNQVKNSVAEIGTNFQNAGNQLAAFDNVLRGMLSLGITAFLSNLIVLAGAAAGAFLALAGSAAMAGAAIGGALVAGIAQAIPVLGLLITAIQRVKAVTDAVQQANLLEQQGGQQRQQQRGQELQQAEQLRASQERIRDAQERVRESRENLNQVQREAVREVERLTLAQRGNVLTLKEAREEERLAIQEGRASDLARARLAIDEARARVGGGARELTAARAGRTPAVESATEQLEASQEALDDARRSAVQTRREVAAAGTEITSGANKLNFLMAQLSDAEKRLFEAIKRLQEVWREFAQEVSAPLIDSFTFAINRVVELLGQPRIRNAARSLSAEMGEQFERVFSAFTDNESIEQFIRIAEQAGDNLKPLGDIAIDVGEAFMDIAEAAGPALERIIGWIADAADKFSEFMDETRKSGELGSFFDDAADHLKAWVDLLVSIGRIFLAIFGPAGGAQTGLGLIKDLTEAFNEFADQIGTRGTKANDFFRDLFEIVGQTIEAFKPVFQVLGDEMAKLFGEEAGSGGAGIKGFANILARVLIPAFFNFLGVMRQAVISVGEFVEEHPRLARIGAVLLSFVGAITVFGRLGALIKPVFDAVFTLVRLFGRLFASGGAARALLARPWVTPLGAIIAAVTFLLIKFDLLDDLWRTMKQTFSNFLRPIIPAFEDLIDVVNELGDALSGSDGLGPAIDFLVNVAFKGLFAVVEEMGAIIGEIVSGPIKLMTGAIKILVGVITLDVSKILDGFKDIGEGILRFLFIPFRVAYRLINRLTGGFLDDLAGFLGDVVEFIIRWGGRILRFLTAPFRVAIRTIGRLVGGLWEVIRENVGGVADKVGDVFSDIAGAITGAFEGVADFISGVFEGVVTGIVSAINVVIGAINTLIDGYNAIPGFFRPTDEIGKIEEIRKGDYVMPEGASRSAMWVGKRQEGGPIPGYGGGDQIPVLAERGEWVIRKEAVAYWGNSMMDFINRAGGRLMGRGSRGRHQQGGPPTAEGAQAESSEEQLELAREQARDMMVIIRRFGRQAIEEWRRIFNTMERITRRSMDDIEKEMERSLRAVYRTIDRSGHRINANWNDTMRNLMRSTFVGMDYVGDAAKEALDAFDAKVPKISVPRPKDLTRAQGGWVGQPGERGQDRVPVWMGRGEAVLNWAHQKVVEPAMHAVYGFGLAEMFDRTKAMHSGGAQRGFMAGGFTGPDGSGEGFTPVANFARNKFSMTMTSGKDSHSVMTASGNVSEHSLGQAGDFSNGVLTPQEDAFSAFWKSKVPQVISQLIWRNVVQAGRYLGSAVSGHEDHVHLALLKQYAFNAAVMARIISRASRGLSISDLLRGNVSGENVDVEHVSKIDVKGKGPLADLVQKVIGKVRDAANKFIDKKASKLVSSPGVPLHGESYDGPLDRLFPAHSADQPGVVLSPAQVMELASKAGLPPRTFMQIAQGESAFQPGVISFDGGYGLWQNTPRVWGASALEYLARLGGTQQLLNPWKNALMAKFLFDSAGGSISPWYGTRYVTDTAPPYAARGGFPIGQYAKGGELPGGEGEALPIVAHSGEWILNRSQQGRLASWMGTTSGQIKRLLGFTGKASGGFYQDGGEVGRTPFQQRRRAILREGEYRLPGVEEMSLALREFSGLMREVRRAGRAFAQLNRKSKDFYETFNSNIEELVKEGGLFDEMAANTERFIATLQTRLLRRQFRDPTTGPRRNLGIVAGRGGLDEPGELAAAEQNILQQTSSRLRRNRRAIVSTYNRVNRELDRVNDSIREMARGGVGEDEKKEFEKLATQRGALEAGLTNLRDRRAEAARAEAENLQARFEAAQEEISRRAGEAEQLSPGEQQAALRRLRGRAGRRGMRELANQIADQISELQVQMAGRASAVLERTASLLEARGEGGTGAAEFVAVAQIDAMRAQQDDLRKVAFNAAKRGNQRLAQEINDQIEDLNVQIAQAASALVQRRIEAVNEAAARRISGIELFGRIADVVQAAGQGDAAGRLRLQLLQQRQGVIGEQIGGLRGVLGQAQAIGNVELVNQLNDQIAELSVQLVENTQAMKDQTTAIRQQAIDVITGRGAFRGGLFGQLGGILQTVSTITGQQTTQRQIEIAQAALTELLGTGVGLRDILARDFGIDLRGLSGGDFVNSFQSAMGRFDSILAGLTEAERTQFESLINAIVENEAALQQNTASLDELKGTVKDPQSWASSAWQWFREAIFTGTGGLLPQYEVPGMQTGGFITRSGMFKLEAGEFVVNPARSGGQVAPGGDTYLTINEAGKPIDLTHLTNRLAFARKNGV